MPAERVHSASAWKKRATCLRAQHRKGSRSVRKAQSACVPLVPIVEADRSGLKKRLRGWWRVVQRRWRYGSAKAKRPPPVYISPRDFATLAPPCTSPPPRPIPTPVAGPPPKHSRPIKRTRVPRSRRISCSVPALWRQPPTISNTNLSWVVTNDRDGDRRRWTMTTSSAATSGYRYAHSTGARPWKLSRWNLAPW
jgi:hypothetical protein